MNIEELKVVMQTLSALGEQGKSAFIWWLVLSELPRFFVALAWAAGFTLVLSKVVSGFKYCSYAASGIRQIRSIFGVSSNYQDDLTASDVQQVVTLVQRLKEREVKQ
jgi:hypothetical protein